MVARRLPYIVVGCLLVGALLGAVSSVGAAPPPQPVCDACDESFTAAAESNGVPLTIEKSTATVTVHENGSATWVVQNHVASSETTARLRANHTLLTTIADDAMWDTEFRRANISTEGVITLRYRNPKFATSSVGGVLRSGAFTEQYGYRNLDGLGADRLTVIAPNGTHVGRTVPGATISDDGGRMTVTQFTQGAIITFVPQDALLGSLLSLLAVGSLLGPVLVLNTLAYVALPTTVFTLLIGAIAGMLTWLDWDDSRIQEHLGSSLAALGLLVTTFSVVAGGGASLFGGTAAPLFGTGIAFVALGGLCTRPSIREQVTYRWLVSGAAVGAIVAAGVTVIGAVTVGQTGLTRSLVTSLLFLIPIFVLLPVGYALGRQNRRLAIGTAAVGFAVSMLPLVPFLTPPLGMGIPLVFFVTGYAILVAIVGIPLLIVGAAFPARESPLHSIENAR